jgi:hypothetical protein
VAGGRGSWQLVISCQPPKRQLPPLVCSSCARRSRPRGWPRHQHALVNGDVDLCLVLCITAYFAVPGSVRAQITAVSASTSRVQI